MFSVTEVILDSSFQKLLKIVKNNKQNALRARAPVIE